MRLVKKGMIVGAKPEVKRRAEATRMVGFRQGKIDFQYFSIIERHFRTTYTEANAS